VKNPGKTCFIDVVNDGLRLLDGERAACVTLSLTLLLDVPEGVFRRFLPSSRCSRRCLLERFLPSSGCPRRCLLGRVLSSFWVSQRVSLRESSFLLGVPRRVSFKEIPPSGCPWEVSFKGDSLLLGVPEKVSLRRFPSFWVSPGRCL